MFEHASERGLGLVLAELDLIPAWVVQGLDCPPWESDALPEVPAWLLDAPASVEEPGCDCGCPCGAAQPAVEDEPVRWAVPGVWDDAPAPAPAVGPRVTRLQQAIAGLPEVSPVALPPEVALAEVEALLDGFTQLRVLLLPRLRDAQTRRLYTAAGFRGSTAWLRTVAPDARAGDLTLAARLPGLPHLHTAVRDGRVSLAGADKVAKAFRKVRGYLDAPDGLLDGLPAEEVVTGMVANVVDLVSKDRFGLETDPATDPAQGALLAQVEAAVVAIQTDGGSRHDRVEQALVLLAQHVHSSRLDNPLEELVLAVLPVVLEQRQEQAQDQRELLLAPNTDGTWHLEATLTPEAGEQLFTVLSAEARRDPANPVDTAARAAARAQAAQEAGGDGWTDVEVPVWERRALRATGEFVAADDDVEPRSRGKRLHDALQRTLTRYLAAGLGGSSGKVPVQITVTVNERTITGAPGAPPARGASGQPVARSLLRRWWCDAQVTTLLLSRGWQPLGVVHTARTLTGTELKAARIQFDNRCAGIDCCPGTPDPLIPLVPHHVRRHADVGTTSLDETVLVCERLHADIHLGKRPVRLRDGRLITEHGYLQDQQMERLE